MGGGLTHTLGGAGTAYLTLACSEGCVISPVQIMDAILKATFKKRPIASLVWYYSRLEMYVLIGQPYL